MKFGGSLVCSDHEMVEFRILRGADRTMGRYITLDFWRDNFALFKDLLGVIPQVRALEDNGVQEIWLLFRHHFLHTQDQCVTMSKKSCKGDRRPAWMSKELLVKFKWKEKVYRMWKEEQVTWEEYENVVRECRDAMRKAKVHLKLNLARDVKDNKKGFFKYIDSKRITSENVRPLLIKVCALVTEDTNKVESSLIQSLLLRLALRHPSPWR